MNVYVLIICGSHLFDSTAIESCGINSVHRTEEGAKAAVKAVMLEPMAFLDKHHIRMMRLDE